MLKITYLAHLKNNEHPENDEEVLYALKKLGHTVYSFDDREFNTEELIKTANKSDVFLFHKGGVSEKNQMEHYVSLQRLIYILNEVKCVKVFWYLDKVYQGREEWIYSIAPHVNLGFLVDETFLRRNKFTNLFPLKQGVSDRAKQGHIDPIYVCQVAHIGDTYGPRQDFVGYLNEYLGSKFRVYQGVYGREFDNLCKSAKVIVAPPSPLDDFYWGDRLYRVLGAGGFLLHMKCYGLQEQGLIEGKHYAGYSNFSNLLEQLNKYLDPKNEKLRKQIAKDGREAVMVMHTYSQRCQQILDKVQQLKAQ